MTRVIHVAIIGSDIADGTESAPLRTINRAAQIAMPGDTVRVRAGVYREWVRPRFGGISDQRRITYEAAAGEHVIIKGSERVASWEQASETVWRAIVPNELFGDFNPYAEEVAGDWITYDQAAPRKHLGEVYLNGKSFYEASSRERVNHPLRRVEMFDNCTGLNEPARDPDQTTYVWYAEVSDALTTIWANFQGEDPNDELAEINVRRSIFYPAVNHIDYITVRGFEMAHAASPWAPPTADQPGLVGPNWAKGWVIEDNIIHDAKCSAISLGKEASTGHNLSSASDDKPGYQYQLESVFSARQIGWDREHVGSHVVRRNTIFDCGQNGIVGHLGCIFSVIEDNHIYNIATKREFYGWEIAGIKLHAGIDVLIRHNRIHDCSLGTWLDWQAQGTRVSRNIYYRNNRDVFVEVSHGPYVMDHNVFGSRASIESFSQGGAYVNNVIAGTVRIGPVMERVTPYHVAHSTQIAGYAAIHGADDRYIGNVFFGGDVTHAYGPTAEGILPASYGTAGYNGHPASFEEYLALIAQQPVDGDHARFLNVKQPAYVRNNVYARGAQPFDRETSAVILENQDDLTVDVIEEGEAVFLQIHASNSFANARVGMVTGADLPRVRFVDADFEERDGTPLVVDVDLLGERKELGRDYAVGPISALIAGATRLQIW